MIKVLGNHFAVERHTISSTKNGNTRYSYYQKADEYATMQNKASPSLAIPFLKNYQEKKHLTHMQLTEDFNVDSQTLHIWKNGVGKTMEVAT